MPETLDEIKKYVGPFTGPQMDQIFYEILNYTSERFAKGTAGGVPVAAGTPGYNDNSLFYKNQAAAQVSLAQAAAAAAANSAQRAESAVPAGTDAAVLWTTDQSAELTADDKAVARNNIMAGGTNPNLVVNPWFTVNQKGFSSTSTNNTWTVDRWIAQNMRTNGVCSLSDNIITLDGTNAVGGGLTFGQSVDIEELPGETVTLSVMQPDGTIYKATTTLPARATSQQAAIVAYMGTTNCQMRLYVNGSTQRAPYCIQFIVPQGYTFQIKAVKLEKGSVSTLANDTPPEPGEELAKCQRHFIRIKGDSNYNIFANGYVNTAYWLYGLIPTPVTMARTPTVTYSGSFTNRVNGTNQTVNDIKILALQTNGIMLQFNSAAMTVGHAGVVTGDINSYIDLNAEP